MTRRQRDYRPRKPIRAPQGLVLSYRTGSVGVRKLDRTILAQRVAEAIENRYAHGIVTLSVETAEAILRSPATRDEGEQMTAIRKRREVR